MAGKGKGKVNKQLEKIINDLLKEVNGDKKDTENKPLFSLTDKMKVIDRALKLEALKLSVDDSGYGSGFEPEPEE